MKQVNHQGKRYYTSKNDSNSRVNHDRESHQRYNEYSDDVSFDNRNQNVRIQARRTAARKARQRRRRLILSVFIALIVMVFMLFRVGSALTEQHKAKVEEEKNSTGLLNTYEESESTSSRNDKKTDLNNESNETEKNKSSEDNSEKKESNSTSLEKTDSEKSDKESNDSHSEKKTENSGDKQTSSVKSAQSPYEIVINRTYPIEADFIAGTGKLATVEGNIQMESNAAQAAREMMSDLRRDGLSIMAVSGYRSDDYQKGLYERQITKQNGNEYKAATISAVPFTSEHQAGLAIDLSIDGSLEQTFEDTSSGKWLAKHCNEYGFIIRYTKDNERSTGVIFEPWHFRYVGSAEVAKKIAASGKSMEQYYGKELADEDIDPYLPYLK